MNSLTLYCMACRENHTFPSRDIERIVYTQHAHSIDLLAGCDENSPAVGSPLCFKTLLSHSREAEEYEDYVEGLILSRQRRQGVTHLNSTGTLERGCR